MVNPFLQGSHGRFNPTAIGVRKIWNLRQQSVELETVVEGVGGVPFFYDGFKFGNFFQEIFSDGDNLVTFDVFLHGPTHRIWKIGLHLLNLFENIDPLGGDPIPMFKIMNHIRKIESHIQKVPEDRLGFGFIEMDHKLGQRLGSCGCVEKFSGKFLTKGDLSKMQTIRVGHRNDQALDLGMRFIMRCRGNLQAFDIFQNSRHLFSREFLFLWGGNIVDT